MKGFAARQFKEVLASSLPELEFLVLLPLPSDLELMFVLGVMFDVPVAMSALLRCGSGLGLF